MFLSVILPVYNVGQYLTECIEAILCQDLPPEEFEAVFVDDGSKDDSGDILRRANRDYPQIRYFRQENAGVSAARNRGLDLAAGDYIWFVDPDDIIAKNCFGALKQAAGGSEYDRICFNHYSFKEHFTDREKEDYEAGTLLAQPQYKDGSVCSSIMRRQWLQQNHLRFRDTKHGEDALFMFELLTRKPKQKVMEDTYYFYRIRGNSASFALTREALMRRYRSRRYDAAVMRAYYEGKNGPMEDKERCANLFMGFLRSTLWSVCLMPRKQAKEELRSLKEEGLFPYPTPKECTLKKSYMTTRTDWRGRLFDFLYTHQNRRWGFSVMRIFQRLRKA